MSFELGLFTYVSLEIGVACWITCVRLKVPGRGSRGGRTRKDIKRSSDYWPANHMRFESPGEESCFECSSKPQFECLGVSGDS